MNVTLNDEETKNNLTSPFFFFLNFLQLSPQWTASFRKPSITHGRGRSSSSPFSITRQFTSGWPSFRRKSSCSAPSCTALQVQSLYEAGEKKKKRKGHCSLEGVSYILTPPFSLRPGSGSKEKKMLTCSAVKLNPGRKTTRHLVLFSLSLSFFSCTVSANQSKHEECDRW